MSNCMFSFMKLKILSCLQKALTDFYRAYLELVFLFTLRLYLCYYPNWPTNHIVNSQDHKEKRII